MKRIFNVWLRRWAEASLRNELHQTQEKLIRSQEMRVKAEVKFDDYVKLSAERLDALKKRNTADRRGDSRLIKALRERMPAELFLSVSEYVRNIENQRLEK
jgi:hypothetical protein